MHFPEHLKSHRSHDIVLLCVDCHEIAHSAAEKYKRRLAQEFGIPLFVQKIVNSGDTSLITDTSASEDKLNGTGVSPLLLRTAAMALLRHGSNMPLKRREELMQVTTSFYCFCYRLYAPLTVSCQYSFLMKHVFVLGPRSVHLYIHFAADCKVILRW
jgi:hypothetical protein